MILLFGLSLFFILYTYVGYPVTLWLMTKFWRAPVRKKMLSGFPSMSVVIAAKNEEDKVDRRLRNLAEQGYPGPLEIVLVSDNSTDETVGRAKELSGELERRGVTLKVLEQRAGSGKPSALNSGVVAASGEIIVFADARQSFAPGAVEALVSNFSDPDVGCVSGELVFVDSERSDLQVEMGAYWRYEKAIRKMESATGSVMGATGAIYAIRREMYRELPAKTLLDDVLTPLNVLCRGGRIVFDSDAVARDVVSSKVGDEWRRKVRTLTGNWQLIGENGVLGKALLHRFFFRFFWHKIARLLVPFMLLLLFFSSFFLTGWFSSLCFGLQLLFYTIAVLAWKNSRIAENSVAKLCYFFCMLNWAVVVGLWVWLRGSSGEIWKKENQGR